MIGAHLPRHGASVSSVWACRQQWSRSWKVTTAHFPARRPRCCSSFRRGEDAGAISHGMTARTDLPPLRRRTLGESVTDSDIRRRLQRAQPLPDSEAIRRQGHLRQGLRLGRVTAAALKMFQGQAGRYQLPRRWRSSVDPERLESRRRREKTHSNFAVARSVMCQQPSASSPTGECGWSSTAPQADHRSQTAWRLTDGVPPRTETRNNTASCEVPGGVLLLLLIGQLMAVRGLWTAGGLVSFRRGTRNYCDSHPLPERSS